jgi:hypothetical protein
MIIEIKLRVEQKLSGKSVNCKEEGVEEKCKADAGDSAERRIGIYWAVEYSEVSHEDGFFCLFVLEILTWFKRIFPSKI